MCDFFGSVEHNVKFIWRIMLEGVKEAANRENDGKAMGLDY